MTIHYKKAGNLLVAAGLLGLLSACGDSGEATGSSGNATDGALATGSPVAAGIAAAQAPAIGTPAAETPAAETPVGLTPEVQEPAETASNTAVANDFAFPEVTEANGTVNIDLPTGPLPTFSARRTLSKGTGSPIGFGDPVVLRYSMYSWSTGELIETTDEFDEPMTIQAGVAEGVPDYLSKSLLGRNVGDKIQVVFESEMEDLPSYLDNADAYILVVDLI